jgi:hypothetical protein
METDGIYSPGRCKDETKSRGSADDPGLLSGRGRALALSLFAFLISSLQRNEIIQKVKHHAG